MKPSSRFVLLLSAWMLLLPGCDSGQVTPGPSPAPGPVAIPAPAPVASAEPLSLNDRSAAISMRFPEAVQDIPVTRLQNPVLTIPEGTQGEDLKFQFDLWVDRGVPNVAVSHAVRKNGDIFRQFALLRNVAVEATIDQQVVWHPSLKPKSRRRWISNLEIETPEPSADADERLTQMKALAARFSMQGATLSAEPVYRYDSSDYLLVDGGVFVLMKDTVRAIVIIEAFKYGDKRGWHYRVNRLTSPPGAILFDGEEVRAWDGYWANPRSDEDEYVEQKVD